MKALFYATAAITAGLIITTLICFYTAVWTSSGPLQDGLLGTGFISMFLLFAAVPGTCILYDKLYG